MVNTKTTETFKSTTRKNQSEMNHTGFRNEHGTFNDFFYSEKNRTKLIRNDNSEIKAKKLDNSSSFELFQKGLKRESASKQKYDKKCHENQINDFGSISKNNNKLENCFKQATDCQKQSDQLNTQNVDHPKVSLHANSQKESNKNVIKNVVTLPSITDQNQIFDLTELEELKEFSQEQKPIDFDNRKSISNAIDKLNELSSMNHLHGIAKNIDALNDFLLETHSKKIEISHDLSTKNRVKNKSRGATISNFKKNPIKFKYKSSSPFEIF